jgi:PQQ-like domain
MKKFATISLLVGTVIGIVGYKLLWTAVEPKIEHRLSEIGMTPNEIAAQGPLPGDLSLYDKELRASAALPTPGYYPSLNAAELADAQRSGLFAQATFTGSFDGPNQVYAWRSEDAFDGVTYINNRQPGELFIVGGDTPAGKLPIPAGPYVASVDGTTGKQIWRTYLDNANVTRNWIGNANLNILDNGNIAFAWATQVVLLDGDTGRILKQNTLPTGETAAADVNFKHLTIAPDRTLILKNQTRPAGSEDQGTMAIIKGVQAGLKQGNSELVAVHPDTLEILDHVSLPEPATVPHIITMFEGRIAIYIGVNTGALRYFWDPATKKLSQDKSWSISPMQKGQTTSDAPSLLGDWIVLQTNGIGSETVASSIVAVNQKDPTKMKTIFPFGELKKGQWSFAPPKPQTDPENSMIYSADMGVGKVAGIKIDQATGEMKTVWVVDNTTSAFQPLIGPKDKRVMLLSNAKQNVEKEPVKLALFTGNYKEQVTWRDAATGRIIAASDFFEPLTPGSLITPGFGGRIYFPTAKGFITMQPKPKLDAAKR